MADPGDRDDPGRDMLRRLAHHYGTTAPRRTVPGAAAARFPIAQARRPGAAAALTARDPRRAWRTSRRTCPCRTACGPSGRQDPGRGSPAGSRGTGGDTSMSGQDWAWTREQLRRGRNAAQSPGRAGRQAPGQVQSGPVREPHGGQRAAVAGRPRSEGALRGPMCRSRFRALACSRWRGIGGRDGHGADPCLAWRTSPSGSPVTPRKTPTPGPRRGGRKRRAGGSATTRTRSPTRRASSCGDARRCRTGTPTGRSSCRA